MAVFPKFKITNKGLDLLNRSIAEKKALTFTKFKIGNGVPSGNWEELNDIVSKFKEFPVLETSVQPNKIVRVKGYFDNKGLTQDYLLKEIGVYAMLEGVAGEILYSYTNAGDTADTIPDENNGFFSRTFDVANYISNATQITFQVLENRFDFNFNTIEEMRNATFLKAGDRVHLWGKTQLGDTTTKTLIVTDTYNGNNDKYTLKNNKIAVVINDIDNKLDKGQYQGDAQDLKNEIDTKQGKIDNSLKTDSKDIAGAINESLWKFISKKLNSDYDSIITEGKYLVDGSGSGIAHAPFQERTNLEVLSAGSEIIQIATSYFTPLSKKRWFNGNSWSEWVIISSGEYRTIGEMTAVGQIVPVGNYTEYILYIDFERGKIGQTIYTNNKYLKQIKNSKTFIGYSNLGIEFEISIQNNNFVLSNNGTSQDAVCSVWAR